MSLLDELTEIDKHKNKQDLLYSVCAKIAKAMHVDVRRPNIDLGKLETPEQLLAIADYSQFHVRKIDLDKNWWRCDHGQLLVFRKEDQTPCAILLTKKKGPYQLFDPLDGKLHPLTAELAATLKNHAYYFYRSFPNKAINCFKLLRFALFGLKKDIIRILGLQITMSLFGLLIPIMMGVFFDQVIPDSNFSLLWQFVIILSVSTFTTMLFKIAQVIGISRLKLKSNVTAQSAVWDRLLRLPLQFFRKYTKGDLAVRAAGIDSIQQMLSGAILTTIVSGIFSVITLGLMFFYDYMLALGAIALALVLVFANTIVVIIQMKYQRKLLEKKGELADLQLQLLSNVSKLRVANSEARSFKLWRTLFDKQVGLFKKANIIIMRFSVFQAMYSVLITGVLFTMVVMRGQILSFGSFIAFSAAFSQFFAAMMSLAGIVATSLQIVVLYERVRPILQASVEDPTLKSDPGILKGNIELSRVSFNYPDVDVPVFKDLSITVNHGEFIAIAGSSGVGKSTLMRLLLGFEQPQSGRILYDGYDLKTLNTHVVRRQLGVVLQNSAILSGTIYENIAGVNNISRDEVWKALKLAEFAEDVVLMPMQLDTVVAEFGKSISVGQRQRLLLARAFVMNPNILIFDEATSALDNTTQEKVMNNIKNMSGPKIIVAHRFSTIIKADRIYVLDQGKVTQSGTYQDLISKPGLFLDLAKRQLITGHTTKEGLICDL